MTRNVLKLCTAVVLSVCVVGGAHAQAPNPPICERTPQVAQVIINFAIALGNIPQGSDCTAVTSVTHFDAIGSAILQSSNITELQSDDFTDMPLLVSIFLNDNQLETLPADFFDRYPKFGSDPGVIELNRNPFSKGLPPAVIERLSIRNTSIDLVAVSSITCGVGS